MIGITGVMAREQVPVMAGTKIQSNCPRTVEWFICHALVPNDVPIFCLEHWGQGSVLDIGWQEPSGPCLH